jgi:aldose sugar dehydrogenase
MKSTSVCIALSLIVIASCSEGTAQSSRPRPVRPAATAASCNPLETRAANASSQQPTFPQQTRACEEKTNVAFDVVVLAKGLRNPWAVEPLPGGNLLVTEKPGQMRIVTAAGQMGAPISGVPPVDDAGQGGLLDVELSPQFASDRTIFWSYTEPRSGGNGTSVARAVLSNDLQRLESVRVIFRAMPTYRGTLHYGSRLAFGPDGMLYITLGERSDRSVRPQAQQFDSHMGKVLRITPDGGVPPDNPFVSRDGALPEIWTLGHRNVQSAAFDAEGRFWTVEHGPRGGDELNLMTAGKNYGWPVVSFGEEYSGQPIADSLTTRPGFEDPVYYWDPVIAPSGAQFYSGKLFPEWRGSLFVGALREQRLVRLSIENGRVRGEEHLLSNRGQRVRDVREGSDGALYVVTDESNGELWKIVPKR